MRQERPGLHDAEIYGAIDKALEENALSREFRAITRYYLMQPNDAWRACCGGPCTPCVIELERVVDRAKELLQGGQSRQ